MLKTELFEILRNGENSGVEFKRDDIRPEELARELVALTNLHGGRVILGTEDNGTVTGLARSPKDTEEWVMNVCRDKIRPPVIPFFETISDLESGKAVAVLGVSPGWTVHHRWHNNRSDYYIRVGSESRIASTEELERLFQQRGALRPEIRGVPGSGIKDLDRRRLQDYFGRVLEREIPGEGSDWETLLENMEFLVKDGNNRLATVAGLLLFGISPNRFLPQAGIDAAAYPVLDKDYEAKERTSIRGPMLSLEGKYGLVETGLVERAVEFVKRNIGVKAKLENDAQRTEKWDYPLEAVREALVNALVHRDYLLSATDIELSIYEDRLEVISPGRLPNGITPDAMRAGCRAARNQLLKDVMRDYRYLEHSGMGVRLKIVEGMHKHNNTEPDLIEKHERFTVRLWKAPHRTQPHV